MNQEKILIIPSKSRYELSLEKYGLSNLEQVFSSKEILNGIYESHLRQKENIQHIMATYENSTITDRENLTDHLLSQHDLFVFLGGDNHFTYCAQQILEYQRNMGIEKKVMGVVLDSNKSTGALLYDTIESFIASKEQIQNGYYSIEKWDTLETKIEYNGSIYVPKLAVSEIFIGETSRREMSRNNVYLNGIPIFEDKSSGILVATGAGSSNGSWFDNEYAIMHKKSYPFRKTSGKAVAILTGNKKNQSCAMLRGDTLEIHSYNDSHGEISPDSQLLSTYDFPMGAKAYVALSDQKLNVIRF